MEHQINVSVLYMNKSHHELARVLEAEREVARHLSQVVIAIPDRPDSFGGGDKAIALSLEAKQSIAAYLTTLSDLEQAMADNLELIVPELHLGEAPE